MTATARGFADLALLVVVAAGATAVLVLPGVPWQLEWALGLPLVLVVPGYAVVAALFPTADGPDVDRPGWAARVAIALVVSSLVVAVVGVALSVAGVLSLGPVTVALGGVSVAGAAVAALRRRGVPVGRRSDPLAGVTPRAAPHRLGLSRLQTVSLVLASLALVGALAVAGATPGQEAAFSEASLVATADGDELLGADGTVALLDGQDNAVHLRLANREGEETTYAVVGDLQRVGPNGTVLDTRRVDEGEVTVGAGATETVERRIDPATTGDALRLQYLVYTGSVPDDPRPASADLVLRHWVEAVGGET